MAAKTENLHVRVNVAALDVRGDTVRVAYTVTNAPTSTADLFAFTVDAATHLVEIERPSRSVAAHTLIAHDFGGRPVASWGFVDPTIAPAASAPSLAYRAIGLPGLVKYWATPYQAPDTIEAADVSSEELAAGPGASAADSGLTVGVVPFPADRSRSALLHRLTTMLDRVCMRGWVDNQGVCNSLRVKIDHDQMDALLNELSAQRGKHVNETAYFLLAGNVWALPR